jgi:hypothetical protein
MNGEPAPMPANQSTPEVTRAEELRALIAKATNERLSDGGRYFAESCDDLTRCRHEEIGYGTAAARSLISMHAPPPRHAGEMNCGRRWSPLARLSAS